MQGDSVESAENSVGFATTMDDSSDCLQNVPKSILLQRMKHFKGLTEIET